MLKNYLKTSFRNLSRYKGYSLINIFGLTIGLATCIFIFLWATDELSFDRFHKNKSRIYRVMCQFTYSDKIETGWSSPVKLAEALQAEIPEVEYTVKMDYGQELLFKSGDKSLMSKGNYADAEIFKVFTFPIIKGNAAIPLPNENSIAISEKMAKNFFDNKDPIGQIFRMEDQRDYKVTSVFADLPKNSTTQFDFVIPFSVWRKDHKFNEDWGNNVMQTFVSLHDAKSLRAVNKKIRGIVKKNCKVCLAEPFLFPYVDFRLYSDFENGKNIGGRISYVLAMVFVALIVLLIACINFMNLSTARAATRSREVGVRKVIGAQRSGIVLQFLSESLLLSSFALIIALFIIQLFLPFFNALSDKSFHLDFTNGIFLIGIIGITLLCGLTAGSYPSIFMSSFQPAAVLKGNPQSSLSGNGLRKILVVVQFTVAIILNIGSVVVFQQISFIRNMQLGFDKENIIVLNEQQGVRKNQQAFKNDLLRYADISGVGVSGNNPFNVNSSSSDPDWPGKPAGALISFKVISCDHDFIPTMEMEIVAGRNFSNLGQQDSSNYIINEKAMDIMGFTPENIIGTPLDMWKGKGKIIGVTRNFNNGHLKNQIDPLIFVYDPTNTIRIYIRIKGSATEALQHIETAQKKYDPDYPFSYTFLDEDFDKEYKNEAMTGKLSLSFTIITIIISCLGLFGLASFTAERRTKEFGVRKALGATATNLTFLLCTDFAKLLIMALAIGCPIAWYLTDWYLKSYAFHTNLDGFIFIYTALGVFVLAMITVGYHSVKAAKANPVDSLHRE